MGGISLSVDLDSDLTPFSSQLPVPTLEEWFICLAVKQRFLHTDATKSLLNVPARERLLPFGDATPMINTLSATLDSAPASVVLNKLLHKSNK